MCVFVAADTLFLVMVLFILQALGGIMLVASQHSRWEAIEAEARANGCANVRKGTPGARRQGRKGKETGAG